jgi:capsular polysaccharide export protein
MDVMFVSKRGSMYTYFKLLCRRLALHGRLFDFSLIPLFYKSKYPLRQDEIANGIAFHLQRKRSKNSFPQMVWVLLEAFYRAKYAYFYRRFEYLIGRYKPGCIAIFNGNRLPEQAVKNIAAKLLVPVVHFENGLLPNTTTFDLSGVNDANSLPRVADFYRQHVLSDIVENPQHRTLVQRKFHRAKSRHSKRSDFYQPLPSRFVFVPFQVHFDSQVLLNSPRIKSMRELYRWIDVVAKNCDDPELTFVIKEHPSDPHRYDDLYQKNPRIVFSNIDTAELIDRAEAVVTLNSSVGMEALFLNKRVFVLGSACYAIEGISQPIDSLSSLTTAINHLDQWEVDVDLIEKYIDYLRSVYCVPESWRNPGQLHFEVLEQRFRQIVEA